jgi:hypothetical protein
LNSIIKGEKEKENDTEKNKLLNNLNNNLHLELMPNSKFISNNNNNINNITSNTNKNIVSNAERGPLGKLDLTKKLNEKKKKRNYL